MWGWNAVESLRQDARYALRAMRRTPAFTSVVVLSLALGIGANTAIFSLINALMLRMLPVEHPEQLVEFLNQYPGDPPLNVFSVQSYEYFRDHNHVFSGLTGVQHRRLHVRAQGLEPETVVGGRVNVTAYGKGHEQRAAEDRVELEKNARAKIGIQVALVAVQSVDTLRVAYPNYFSDTQRFLKELDVALHGTESQPIYGVA